MVSTKSLFASQIQFEAGILSGLFNRPDIARTYLALCNSVSGGVFVWDETATIGQVLATEVLETNGYARMHITPGNYRAISGASTSTGVLTLTGSLTGYVDGAPVDIFATGTSAAIAPFVAGGTYYLRDVDPINNQVRLAASVGGAAILPTTITVTNNHLALHGSYDSVAKKYTSVPDTAILTAVGGSIAYTDIVLITDMNGTWANRPITSLDIATGIFTTTSAHGFTTADSAFLTVDSGGTLPVASSPAGVSVAAGRVFRILSPSGSTFRLSVDGTSPVLFSANFTGTLRVRNGSGRIASFTREDTDPATAVRTIAAATSRAFKHNRILS